MTTTGNAPSAVAADSWNQQLAQLKDRYKHVRHTILVALNILLHERNIALADAKAQAELHGTRITAASLNAAKTLLSRMDAPAPRAARATAPATAEQAAKRAQRRARATEIPFDAEALVRGVVAKIQGHGNAETERLRDAVKKAIAMLQAAVG